MHKAPQLDLVGWFTLGSADGPKSYHLPIHEYISAFNEAAVMLLFDAHAVAEGSLKGGKLPLRIYEGVWEPIGGGSGGAPGGKSKSENADEEMADEGSEQQKQQHMRFRELSHSVETGGAEMIAVDFVAKGGASASSIAGGASSSAGGKSKGKGKGKGKALATEDLPDQDNVKINLAPDEEECKFVLLYFD